MELALLDFDNTLTNNKGIVLEDTILDIKKYTKDNKICIISNSSFNELNKFKCDYSLDISFFSLNNLMGSIDNKLYYSNIKFEKINEIIDDFKDYIYTIWSSNSFNSFIYNYQERLNFFYPKEDRMIFEKLDKDLPYLCIALNKGNDVLFFKKIKELNLCYEIIASDLKRNIIKIFNENFDKLSIFNNIIKYFNPNKTIGIGDGLDNLDFINLCDEKIAIKDSILSQNIKKTTNKDNNFNGCLDYLINR